MNTITKNEIDRFLDTLIFNQLGGFYKKGGNVDINLFNNDPQNKKYLGTYFWRSYNECYTILNEMCENHYIRETFENMESVNILDIGSGCGGNLIGAMAFLTKNGWTDKEINIFSIDGNENAIGYQSLIVDKFNQRFNTSFNVYTHHVVFKDKEALLKGITEFAENLGVKFDIIMSFKFISEFYNSDSMNAISLYSEFTEVLENYLCEKGLMIILDVVAGNFTRTRGFTTQILSSNFYKYLNNENSKLSCILPLSCALWHRNCMNPGCYTERVFTINHSRVSGDISKVAYRVLTHKQYAGEIMMEINEDCAYQVSYNKKRPKWCSRGKIFEVPSIFSYKNAFIL